MRLHAQIKTGGAAKGKQRSGGSRGGDAPVAGKRVGQVPLWRGATHRRLPAKRPVTPLAGACGFKGPIGALNASCPYSSGTAMRRSRMSATFASSGG